ncbi:MAG: RrF2 family transcriptional regulator [Candidatus Methylomirabilia bacterium]
MLRFTKRADYGLMAVYYIASHQEDGAVSSKRIAGTFSIPHELLAKVLQQLARKGLITGQNGPKGGYVLTRSPEEITVGQVIRVLEGPVKIVSCVESLDCPQYSRCNWRGPVQTIQASISQLLDTMTMAELANDRVSPLAELQGRY